MDLVAGAAQRSHGDRPDVGVVLDDQDALVAGEVFGRLVLVDRRGLIVAPREVQLEGTADRRLAVGPDIARSPA
jgi:hypothetical protein